ncbi:MAG: hypothetical protein R6U51_05815 [Anaerolineales bacterium]
MVKFLIEQDADMTIENLYTETAHCLAGNREVEKFLAGLGAKPQMMSTRKGRSIWSKKNRIQICSKQDVLIVYFMHTNQLAG